MHHLAVRVSGVYDFVVSRIGNVRTIVESSGKVYKFKVGYGFVFI